MQSVPAADVVFRRSRGPTAAAAAAAATERFCVRDFITAFRQPVEGR